MNIYNCNGKRIKPEDLRLISDEYGRILPNGKVEVKWASEDDNIDSNGYDKHNVESNGQYTITIELEKGTKLCRFGPPSGFTTSPVGTNYDLMALPFVKETREYHEYVVIADGLSVKLIVEKGISGAMFNSPGGAVQYTHMQSIAEEIYDKKLKEDMTWLQLKNNPVNLH